MTMRCCDIRDIFPYNAPKSSFFGGMFHETIQLLGYPIYEIYPCLVNIYKEHLRKCVQTGMLYR